MLAQTSSSSWNLDIGDHYKEEQKLSGSLGFWANSLVDDVGETAGNQFYGDADVRYQNTYNNDHEIEMFKKSNPGKKTDNFQRRSYYSALDIAARINNEDQLMFSIREAVWEKRFLNSRLALGRTTLDWSAVDAEWGLGRINNRVNFDYFEPGQEGLVGLFYDYKFDNGFKAKVFASFIYVPELNPGQTIDEEEGTVECNNPWCTEPGSEAEVSEGNTVPIFYNVNMPSITETVLKYSAGLNLGQEFSIVKNDDFDVTLDISAYALKKPENSPSISAEVTYENDNERVFVDITPKFYYHDIVGGDVHLKFKKQGYAAYGSAIRITPNGTPEGGREFYKYTGIRQRKIREDYLSAGGKFVENDLKLQAGYIARVSEFDRKDDVLVQYPRWNQAIHLAAAKQLTRKFNVALDYKYDMLTEDRLTMLKTNYRFGKSVVAGLGVNVIGTNPDGESYWSDYENNDAVYTTLKYTF